MPYNNGWPYTDVHQLNLDWIVDTVKDIKDKTDEIDAAVETSAENANAAQESAENASESELKVAQDKESIEESIQNWNDQSGALRNQVNVNTSNIVLQTSRIDQIIAGTTPDANAELIDIRVALDGEVYPTAGDAVRGQFQELRDDLGYHTETDILQSSDFEQNSFQATTGANSNASNRVRTIQSLDLTATSVSSISGWSFLLYGWNGSSYLGVWNSSTQAFAQAIPPWSTNFSFSSLNGISITSLRLVLRKDDNSNITPSDVSNIVTVVSIENAVASLNNRMTAIEADVAENTVQIEGIEDVLKIYWNIANPADQVQDSVWSQPTVVYAQAGWSRQEIAVKENTAYTADWVHTSFSWFLDENNQSLGQITDNYHFTTPAGCTKIRVSKHSTDPFVILNANVSGVQQPAYLDYPYLKMFSAELENTEGLSPYESATVALFETVGVCGDSYSSGGIYGVGGVPAGAHYSISWEKIMGRRNGINCYAYAKGAVTTETWLTDPECLPKMLADPARNLYMIMLGINDLNANVGTINDIDDNDPSQNANSFYGNYARIYHYITDHAPNAKLIFVKPPLTGQLKLDAIDDMALRYGVPVIDIRTDPLFSSSFYNNNLHTSHPIAITYSGMALAFERQISKCLVDYASYFTDYYGND